MAYAFKIIDSPVGPLRLIASEKGLASLGWERGDAWPGEWSPLVDGARHPILLETERQLGEYFAGKRKQFTVPLDFAGTDFQKKVWAALLAIPFGETRSYGEIARQIGRPTAYRAVGAANGKNPIAIIAPCHRVIGSTGALTGFGGGLDVKEALLSLESADRALRRPEQHELLLPSS